MNDQLLIEQHQAGDRAALSVLINRYQAKLYTTIFLMVRQKDIADDLLQDSFVRIIETIQKGRYNHQGLFFAWAQRIARNITIDHLRKVRHFRSSNEPLVSNSMELSEPGADSRLISQPDQRIGKVLDMLRPEWREVMIMRHYAGMSFREIAQIQGVSINTVLGHSQHGRNKMRKIIEKTRIVLTA